MQSEIAFRESAVTRNLPPSTLEVALLKAVEQARAGHQREIAVSLSMILEDLRRQQEDFTPSGLPGAAASPPHGS